MVTLRFFAALTEIRKLLYKIERKVCHSFLNNCPLRNQTLKAIVVKRQSYNLIIRSTMEKPSVEQIKQIVRNLTESDDPIVHKATVEK